MKEEKVAQGEENFNCEALNKGNGGRNMEKARPQVRS